MNDEQMKRHRDLWYELLLEVTHTTFNLFCLLEGVSKLRGETHTSIVPNLPRLRTRPTVIVPKASDMDVIHVDVEQLAYKGWVEQVYQAWERRRTKLKETLGENAICPEQDVLGNFGYIRNDVVHNDSIASKGNTGRCKVLKWFVPPQPIVFKIWHVFDFLNHLGWLSANAFHRKPGMGRGNLPSHVFYRWDLDENKPADNPRLVSLRKSRDHDGEVGAERLMVSCVFDDGVFGCGPIDPSTITDDEFKTMHIGSDGDLRFEGSDRALPASGLYDLCVQYLRGDSSSGPGMYGPAYRIRRRPQSV